MKNLKLENVMPLLHHDDVIVYDDKLNIIFFHVANVIAQVKNRELYDKCEVGSIHRGQHSFKVFLKESKKVNKNV